MTSEELVELIKALSPLLVSLTAGGIFYKIYLEKIDLFKERGNIIQLAYDNMVKLKDAQIEFNENQVNKLTEQVSSNIKQETNFNSFDLEKPLIYTKDIDLKRNFEKFIPFFNTLGDSNIASLDFDADTFLLIHIYFYGAKEYNKALNFINKSIEKSPLSSNLHSYKAGTLKKLGNYDEALKSCEMAITLNIANADAYYNMASIYALKGEIDKIEIPIKKAVYYDKSYKDIILKSPYFQSYLSLISSI